MKKGKILKLNDIRRRNMLSLLELLLQNDSLSRIELAQKMNCDNTTVTRAVRDLFDRGLLMTCGKTGLHHGRPREQLSLNPDGKYMIGIALSPNGIIGAVTDFRGKVRMREQTLFRFRRTRALFLNTLESIAERLLRFADKKLAGIGVSTFGAGMESGTGGSNTANFPELNDLNLRDFFLAKFHAEPKFSNMMICRTYYELIRHPESRSGSTLLVSAGSGIGIAAALDGRIVFPGGRHGGELGHNICEPDGLPCPCGRRGCLETRCSTDVLLRKAKTVLKNKRMDLMRLAALYRENNPEAEFLVAEVIHYLSIALANQINNFAPDRMIVSGELTCLGQKFFESLGQAIRSLLFPFASQNLELIWREVDDECDAVGAALQVTAERMNDPDAFENA